MAASDNAVAQQQQQFQGGPGAYNYQPTAADVLIDIALRSFFDFFQRALSSPMDRMMVLTATEGELKKQGRLPASGFGGVWGCIKRVWKKEGLAGFFRGLAADYVLSFPSGLVDAFSTNLVFFSLQRLMPKQFADNMNYTQVLVVSLCATVVAVTVASPYNALRKSILTNYMADIVAPVPAEIVDEEDEEKEASGDSAAAKQQQQQQAGSPIGEAYRYATATETARSIWRRQGWRAFYRGAVVDPIVVCAYRSIYVATVSLVSPDVQMLHPAAVARGMAVVADLLTQPLEVISRRLILTASDEVHPPYKGVVDCVQTIVKSEGVTALWSGLKFRLLSSAVSVCLQMMFAAGGGSGGDVSAPM